MLEIGQLSVTLDARELLRGHVILPELVVSRLFVLLERNDAGEGNWPTAPLGSGDAGRSRTPTLRRVRLDGGVVRYRDPTTGTAVDVEVSTPQLAPPESQVVEVRARGDVLGRAFSVQRIEATVAPELNLVADGVRVANAPWGTRPIMAAIERASVKLDLASLLGGQLVVRDLQLSEPNVLLETSRDGKRNWSVAAAPGAPATPAPGAATPESGGTEGGNATVAALLGRLEIENGTLVYRDPQTDTDVTVTIDRAGPRRAGPTPTMGVKGRGRYRGARFALEGRVGTLLAIQDQRLPYPIDVRVEVGETRAALRGTLTAPLELTGMNVDLTLEGPDLSKLYPFIPVPLPETPPYRLRGRLDHLGQAWRFAGFQGRVGDSDLGGDFEVDLSGPRPRLRGDLVSRNLEFDDLAPLVGAPPNPAGTASAEQRKEAAERATRDRILPDRPYRLERIRAADADVRFRGERLIAPGLPLEDLTAQLRLTDGRLQLQPITFGVAGGRITASVLMDAGREPLSTAADVTVTDLDLQRLFPGFKLSGASAGLIGGFGRVTTQGDSVALMLGSMNGDVALVMTGGRVSKLLLELADLDLASSTMLWVGGDKSIPIRCMVADFHADDGRLTAKTFVLDSTDTRVDGEGTIDFKNEGLGLTLSARAKRPSLIAFRGPIRVGGHFKVPTVRPDVARLSLRAGVAAVLGFFLTPPAAALPFIELGVAKDANCVALIESAQGRVMTARAGR